MMPEKKPKDRCTRCGTCCRKGGPALHSQDLERIGAPGAFGLEHLVTLRRGEYAHDPVADALVRLDEELVKINGSGPGLTGCTFFVPDAGCAIHPNRPHECRLLLCVDTAPFEEAYAEDRLTRLDILPADHPLADLIRAHDEACPPAELESLLERDDTSEQVAAMLRYDTELRARLAADPRTAPWTEFLIGRPLSRIMAPMGVDIREENGRFRITFNEELFRRNTDER